MQNYQFDTAKLSCEQSLVFRVSVTTFVFSFLVNNLLCLGLLLILLGSVSCEQSIMFRVSITTVMFSFLVNNLLCLGLLLILLGSAVL